MNVVKLLELKEKVALVTGGGRGIGQFIAEGLAEAGANVVVASRKVERCAETARNLRTFGVQAIAAKCDLNEEQDIANVVEVTMREFGRIDILVNNSGTGWIAPTLDYPIDRWDKVLRVNLRGPWILTQRVARRMKRNGGGKIIFVSSIWGEKGIAEEIQPIIAYNVSKGAINALVRDLAVKLARYKIYVNAIAPGLFKTDMAKQFENKEKRRVKKVLIRSIPLGRIGECDDIKGLSVFLASGASDYLTGQIINLDGGASCTYMPTRF